jgi:hypothetical protein
MHTIRWLGAFGRATSVADMCSFERAPIRHVSAAVQTRVGNVGTATVGLRVDCHKTKLVTLYGGDAWTACKGHNGSIENDARYFASRRWIDGAKAVSIARMNGYGYAEAVIANPVYSAVVYRAGDATAKAFAKRVAAEMSLPLEAVRF